MDSKKFFKSSLTILFSVIIMVSFCLNIVFANEIEDETVTQEEISKVSYEAFDENAAEIQEESEQSGKDDLEDVYDEPENDDANIPGSNDAINSEQSDDLKDGILPDETDEVNDLISDEAPGSISCETQNNEDVNIDDASGAKTSGEDNEDIAQSLSDESSFHKIKNSINKAPANPYSKRLNGIANCGWVAWDEAYKNTGIALPVFNGGAGTWYEQAKAKGLSVGTTPRARSIVVWKNNFVGHVAYVEKYRASDNKIYIHEGGYNNIDYSESWVNATGSRFSSPRSGDGSVVVGYIYLVDVPVSGISLMTPTKTIPTNGILQLFTTVTPETAKNKKLIYSSSNKSVATVDSNGKITAHRYGKATITATSADNSKVKASVTIQTRYYDVCDSSKYYYKPVYWAAEKGITQGYRNVYFGPKQNCTRREMMIFLWRLSGKPEVSGVNAFPDVHYANNSDSFKAILWGNKTGIIKGFSDGNFKPDDPVTRKDTLIMLYRLAGKPAIQGNLGFKDMQELDYSKTSDTYKAILWGTEKGITKGYSTGIYKDQFRPFDDCLREHIVTFIYRYSQKIK